MTPLEQKLWDQWSNLSVERALVFEEGRRFNLEDALEDEWSVGIVGGQRNSLGKAFSAALDDPRYQPQLAYVTSFGVPLAGSNHRRYRRN